MTVTELDDIIAELLEFGLPNTPLRKAILAAARALEAYRQMLVPKEG